MTRILPPAVTVSAQFSQSLQSAVAQEKQLAVNGDTYQNRFRKIHHSRFLNTILNEIFCSETTE